MGPGQKELPTSTFDRPGRAGSGGGDGGGFRGGGGGGAEARSRRRQDKATARRYGHAAFIIIYIYCIVTIHVQVTSPYIYILWTLQIYNSHTLHKIMRRREMEPSLSRSGAVMYWSK